MDAVRRGVAYRIGQVIGWALGIALCLLCPPLWLVVFRRRLHF